MPADDIIVPLILQWFPMFIQAEIIQDFKFDPDRLLDSLFSEILQAKLMLGLHELTHVYGQKQCIQG